MVTGLAVAMWLAIFLRRAAHQVSEPARSSRQYSSSLHNCTGHVTKSWRLVWETGGCKTHSERTWLKLPRCLFFLQLALYPVNSASLVDSAHPSFCVPSSFHWLDLRRLFAGYPNGFRQLLELVWTPEALTKSTSYPALAGMGSSIISQEADLEVLPGKRKHNLDARQKIEIKKGIKSLKKKSLK